MINIDWRKIRVHKRSQNAAFEELVCQLAYQEPGFGPPVLFTRAEAPDGGVECFWRRDDGTEIGWQAKYHIDRVSEGQYRQVEKSFKKALETHPQLTEYYVCLPVDFADPRIPGKKSAQDKWDEQVIRWSEFAKTKKRNIKFHFWGSFQLTERLSRSENAGRRYYWFNDMEFSDAWFQKRQNESIKNLGSRYTPQLNVELDISKSFNGIYRSADFAIDLNKYYHDFVLSAQYTLAGMREPALDDLQEKLTQMVEAVKVHFKQINYEEIIPIDIPTWEIRLAGVIDCVKEITKKMDELDKSDKAEKIARGSLKKEDMHPGYDYHLFSHEKNQARKLSRNADLLHRFLTGESTLAFNKPFILLKGEKGMGKSHLLADIGVNKLKKRSPSLLILGQHFNSGDPWVQILNKMGISANKDEFLGALNAKAQSIQSRVVIIIDAINEGAGIELWPHNLPGMISLIQQFEWIGLILSIRSPYEKLIFEKDYIRDNLIELTHHGFDENEYEASKFFFKEYGIEQPKIPLLYPEFRSPLFLKLFCEGLQKAGKTAIPKHGYEGISEIMGFLVKTINEEIAKPTRLYFSASLNIAGKALEIFMEKLVTTGEKAMLYEDAHLLLEESFARHHLKPGLLEELIREDLLSKTLVWKNDEYREAVYFTYHRYEDHFKAKYLLSKHFDPANPKKAFAKSAPIGLFFKDDHTAYYNVNLLEALAIQLPELTGLELFEVLPKLKRYNFFIGAIIDSLLWRKVESIDKKLFRYLKTCFSEDNFKKFIDIVLLLSGKPDHPFNSEFIHKWLYSMTMADRDAQWSTMINKQYVYTHAVKRLVDWCWNDEDKSHLSDESVQLVAVSVAWFLSATNRTLRDSATKALVAILRNRIHLITEILKKFKHVNDTGIYERLFAAAYGSVLISSNIKYLPELAQYIYHEIFDQSEIFPHILLRDYARNLIDYAIVRDCKLDIELKKIAPPYRSEWYTNIPNNAEIKKREFDHKSPDFKDYYWSQNSIIMSVNGSLDDFDKDELKTITHHWKINLNEIQRIVIKRVFELGYDVEKHGRYDRHVDDYSTQEQMIETIGKKYQWQAFYEIAAKVSDHFDYSDKDTEAYNGPWEPYMRDIDPSLLITKTETEQYQPITKNWWFDTEYNNWSMDHKKWIHLQNDVPKIQSLVNLRDPQNNEWLLLDGDVFWEPPQEPGIDKHQHIGKDVRIDLQAFLVTAAQKNAIIDYLSDEGRPLVNTTSRRTVYEVFSREYYWSAAYRDHYETTFYQLGFDIENRRNGETIGECLFVANHFLWEEHFDRSKEEAIRYIKPSKILFDGMDLTNSHKEGQYLNKKGELVCFDPSVYHPGISCLLVRKIELFQFLQKEKMDLIWMVIGEKRLFGHYRMKDRRYWGQNNFKALYYYTGDHLDGWFSSKIEEHD